MKDLLESLTCCGNSFSNTTECMGQDRQLQIELIGGLF